MFYQGIDPLQPLDANDEKLYVDWQKDLGADDVKGRLARSLARLEGGNLPFVHLFTGHRGCGKTTELYRVKRKLELPTIYDLINNGILARAREELKSKGYEDILIIVDELDRIPQKVLHTDLTNPRELVPRQCRHIAGARLRRAVYDSDRARLQ